MTLRPLQDRVLVRRAQLEAKTAGGIFIPDAVQQKPLEGEIIAVGPGTRGKDGELKVTPGEEIDPPGRPYVPEGAAYTRPPLPT